MSEERDKVIDKIAKRSVFPNITTAYAVVNAKADTHTDASSTIKENNQKAP